MLDLRAMNGGFAYFWHQIQDVESTVVAIRPIPKYEAETLWLLISIRNKAAVAIEHTTVTISKNINDQYLIPISNLK